jgi:hypothetical protein
MWGGVTRGFAGIKLSGSPSMYGAINVKKVKNISIIMNPKMSLYVKYGWKGILSEFLLIPSGLFEPV